MQAAPIPTERIESELADVLARGGIGERESLLERLIDWLAPHLRTREIHVVGNVLEVLLIAAAAAALVLVVRRAWSAFRAPLAGEDEDVEPGPDPRERARELAAAGAAARASGDLRLALRLFLQALLVALGGRGDLELRPAWTNRELLRRGKPSRTARALLEPLVRELEPKEFGRAPVADADVQRLERLLAPHLGGGPG